MDSCGFERVVSRRARIILLTVAALVLVISTSGVAGDQTCLSECGIVSGNVREISGSSLMPLPGAKLVFFDKDWRGHEVKTDASGNYEVSLPYGNYSTVVLKDGDCGVQRPPFRILAGERLAFTFILVPCASDGPSFEYHEESIPADSATGRPEVRITFGDHSATESGEAYKSFIPQHSQVPFLATLAVDAYTVRATTIILHREPVYFVAEGAVEVSDGHTSELAEKVKLSFRRGVPVLETEH